MGVDPVAFGLVKSLSRPDGNLTGTTSLYNPLHEKRLQMLYELVPDAKSIGLIANPKNQNAASHKEHVAAAAQALSLNVEVLTAGSADELEADFSAATQRGIRALLLGDDPFYETRRDQLVALAARYRVPTMYYTRDFVAAGSLISYSSLFTDNSRQAGAYAGRILKGAKPADLPVVQPTRFELVINLKTAQALGLTCRPPCSPSPTRWSNRADDFAIPNLT